MSEKNSRSSAVLEPPAQVRMGRPYKGKKTVTLRVHEETGDLVDFLVQQYGMDSAADFMSDRVTPLLRAMIDDAMSIAAKRAAALTKPPKAITKPPKGE